jgi:hypothetical protein
VRCHRGQQAKAETRFWDTCDYPGDIHGAARYLGLTAREYEVWRYDPFALPCIRRARQPGEGLVKVMAARYRQPGAVNRREDETIIFSPGSWPRRQPLP